MGNDSQGNVKFTGYFEPIYQASRQKTAEYKYPLYRRPANFSRWSKPHPARVELEGTQGIGVVLAETDQAAKSVIEAFRQLEAIF